MTKNNHHFITTHSPKECLLQFNHLPGRHLLAIGGESHNCIITEITRVAVVVTIIIIIIGQRIINSR